MSENPYTYISYGKTASTETGQLPGGVKVIATLFVIFGSLGILMGILGIIQTLVMPMIFVPQPSASIQLALADSPINTPPSTPIQSDQQRMQRQMEQKMTKWAENFQGPKWIMVPIQLFSTFVSVLMLVGGIGLFQQRIWGWKASIWTCYMGVVNLTIGLLYTAFSFSTVRKAMSEMPLPGKSPASGMVQEMMGYAMIFGVVFSAFVSISIIALYIFVANYLKKPQIAGLFKPIRKEV